MITFGILIALCFGSALLENSDENTEAWKKYKNDFNRTYNSTTEEDLRRQIFLLNLSVISNHNKNQLSTFKVAINQFSDFTFNEIIKMNELMDIDEFDFTDVVDLSIFYFYESFDVKVPESFDWRERGVVTRVRDQKLCGSCYAFSSLHAIESQLILKFNKSFELSVQEVLDCGSRHGTLNCNGGFIDGVFSYIKSNGGIGLEKNYPYHGAEGGAVCEELKDKVKISIKGYYLLLNESEETLKAALYLHGPIIVTFDSLHDLFIKYSSGIYFNPECLTSNDQVYEFNHVALMVGYGTEDGTDFWIVKNSWDITWGENGYFRIARNKNFHCEIGKIGHIPILE